MDVSVCLFFSKNICQRTYILLCYSAVLQLRNLPFPGKPWCQLIFSFAPPSGRLASYLCQAIWKNSLKHSSCIPGLDGQYALN
uniref:Uncharacterized protein n=1 Tax=Anguilla anguilla TaxID=7936 RepID=A0A0E9WGF2_ANGAN